MILGISRINLLNYVSLSQTEIHFSGKDLRATVDSSIGKKSQTIRFSVKSKRGFAGQAFKEGESLSITDTTTEIFGGSSEIEGDTTITTTTEGPVKDEHQPSKEELVGENEALKQRYNAMVAKYHSKKQKLEVDLKKAKASKTQAKSVAKKKLEQHIKYLQEKEGEKFSDFIKIHAAMLEENDTLKKKIYRKWRKKNAILEKKVKEMEVEKLSHTEIVQEKISSR